MITSAMELVNKIRNIPDFPQKGIIFRDITTLLQDAQAFRFVIDAIIDYFRDKDVDVIVAIEARGYVIAAPVAYNLGVGLVPVRKPGKLPAETISEDYELEYGKNTLEIHKDAIKPGQKVLIIDDLIATGGSCLATKKLVERLGGVVVGFGFVIELEFLKGRRLIQEHDIFTLVKYSEEK